MLGLLVAAHASVRAAPDPNWSAQFTVIDCSGAAQQGTAACDDYAIDLYENLNYTMLVGDFASPVGIAIHHRDQFRLGEFGIHPGMMAAHLSVFYSHLFKEPKDFARAEEAVRRCLEIDSGEAKLHEDLGDV